MRTQTASSFSRAVFVFIFSSLALNSIFNSLAYSLGFQYPYTSFLFYREDLFADFFKSNFAIARELGILLNATELPSLIKSYLLINPYHGLPELESGMLTVFHLPPLTMLVNIVTIYLMKWFGGMFIYIMLTLILVTSLYLALRGFCINIIDSLLWLIACLMTYPALMIITRGNLFAGLAGLSIGAYCILTFMDSRKYLALFFLAVAVNVRPNLIFLSALFLIFHQNFRIKYLLFFLISSCLILFGSLFLDHLVFPDYTLQNFFLGLKNYHTIYVENAAGVEFGSSLFGAVTILIGSSKNLEISVLIFGILLIFYSSLLLYLSKISPIAYSYVMLSICSLSTVIFADYHLIVFIIPLLLLFLQKKGALVKGLLVESKIEFYSILYGCLFLLVPKNYFYLEGALSLQVLINPVIMLITIVLVLFSKNLNHIFSKEA